MVDEPLDRGDGSVMNVLLVYPRFPKTYWSFHGVLELLGRQVLLPPLGLITVAALLPPHWGLKLVDCNCREVTDGEWAWADLVICSAMLVQKADLCRQIALAKGSHLPVAVGGPFPSSTPDALELQDVDYLILDEGEITIPKFLEALAKGETRGRFSAAGEKPDVVLSPIPRFDLLDLKAYSLMAVQFSRGCPFQCEFCDIIVLYGRKPRTKSPQQLLSEFEALLTLGWRGEIFLVDDNFIGNKRNVKLLLPALLLWQQQHQFPFAFTTEASIDLAADSSLMEAMVACGFQRVFLGIETPDQGSLLGAQKLQNIRSPLVEAVDGITAQGLEVMAGFILGFDGERPGAGERIVAFVEQTAIPLAMVGILQAIPNTALWQRLASEGRLIDHQDGFDQGVQTHLLNFRPTRPMPAIAQEYLSAFMDLYDPHIYMRRVYRYSLKLAEGRYRRTDRPEGQRQQPLAWNQGSGLLRGLFTLIWRQGVRRDTRWLFWRQLLALAWCQPEILDTYLWLLMLNEHFLDYQQPMTEQIEAQLRSGDFEVNNQVATNQLDPPPHPAALIAPMAASGRQLTPSP
jgi:radical SAM superfamily enzyme YgiQ (UPF0313 family)